MCCPRWLQDGQDGSKMAPRWLQDGSKMAKLAQDRHSVGLRRPNAKIENP